MKAATWRVWAPIGARPIALGHRRFKWLYVAAFVSPAAGERFWRVANGESKPLFEAPLGMFAQEAGAGRDPIIVLVLDNAGAGLGRGIRRPGAVGGLIERPLAFQTSFAFGAVPIGAAVVAPLLATPAAAPRRIVLAPGQRGASRRAAQGSGLVAAPTANCRA